MITLLEDWYPELHRQWVDEGRRLYVPVSERIGFTIHHTAGGDGDDPESYARWVADDHYRKWERPGGYNFQIGLDGTIFEMCSWEYVGAHAPGCNYSTIGVSFQGTFHSRVPNDRQLKAFSRLVAGGPVDNDQQGHRDCSSTTCPGDALYARLPLHVEEDPMATLDQEDVDNIAEAVARKLGWYDDDGRLRSYENDAKALRLGVRENGAKLGVAVEHETTGVNPA